MRFLGFFFVAFTCAAACSSTNDAAPTDGGAGLDSGSDVVVDTAPAEPRWFVLVRGDLATSDPVVAKSQHDALASSGEAAAKSAGDVGHTALDSSGLFGGKATDFFAVDRWTDPAGLAKFYADPAFGAAFRKLFSADPKVEVFAKQDWYSWGTLDSGKVASPYYWVFVRGRLKESDAAKSQVLHDGAAKGGESTVKAAGDVAHVVFTGLADPQEFLAIDVWTKKDAIEAVYSNDDFQKSLAPLFETTPTLAVGRSTDWHQW